MLEYERDKESQNKRIAELSALNGDLQAQLTSLRQELLVANTELRVHTSHNHAASLLDQPYPRGSTFSQDANGRVRDQQVLAAEARVQELSKQYVPCSGFFPFYRILLINSVFHHLSQIE